MPIPLRADFDATQVLALARTSEDARQVRRLLALAAIYDGASRTEAALYRRRHAANCAPDWVVKFNVHGPDGLIDRKAPCCTAAVEQHPSLGTGRYYRERSDPRCSRRCSLADRRSLPMGVGRVPSQHRQADPQP